MKNRGLPGGQVLLWIAFIVWLSVLFAPLRITSPDKMRDFEVFWTAASRAAAAAPLYRVEDGHFQFKYLPAFAVVASPASLLPLDVAKGKWLTVSIGLIVVLIASSVRLLPTRRRPVWVLVAVMIVAMAKFYGHELTLGQVNLAFAVLVVTGIFLLGGAPLKGLTTPEGLAPLKGLTTPEGLAPLKGLTTPEGLAPLKGLTTSPGRPALAAGMLVAAVVVKPYAVLFLPWVALLGGWRALVSAVIGMAAVVAAPVGLYGVRGTLELHLAWWATVTTSTAPNLTNPDNVSVAAFAAKWLGVGTGASLVAALVSVALLGLAAFVILRGRGIPRREVLEGALLLTLVPLISPQGWDYVFLVATPAIAVLANSDSDLPRPLRVVTWVTLGVIGLSIYDLLGRQRYRAFMDWSVITVCFVIVLGALGTLRLRRAA